MKRRARSLLLTCDVSNLRLLRWLLEPLRVVRFQIDGLTNICKRKLLSSVIKGVEVLVFTSHDVSVHLNNRTRHCSTVFVRRKIVLESNRRVSFQAILWKLSVCGKHFLARYTRRLSFSAVFLLRTFKRWRWWRWLIWTYQLSGFISLSNLEWKTFCVLLEYEKI